MRLVMLYHSLVSDWNHGNAHFLRGVASELQARGHDVRVWEPADSWSRRHLVAEHGPAALTAFARAYPQLEPHSYDPQSFDAAAITAGADVVIVHEWTDPRVVAAVGQLRRTRDFVLLFHDTHHRAVSAPHEIDALELGQYDAALVFGQTLQRVYEQRGWCRRVFTWHEAADTRVFFPRAAKPGSAINDLVWIGNWGDGERAHELQEFLISPVRTLRLSAEIFGVRYPPAALTALHLANITYRGWLPNFDVPEAFARARFTVHVPRRHYAEQLPGIPTIRPFEAMACGIPLLSAPWTDSEHLFEEGVDHLMVQTGAHMQDAMQMLLDNPSLAQALGERGRATILARHTCGHRVDELFSILSDLSRA